MGGTIALIQARMSSSRFPGKVLEPLADMPMLAFMVERARRARRLDQVVVLTSTDPSDDALADMLVGSDIPMFRGALDDVLDRYASAAASLNPEVIVRLTGDCPLVDPAVVDQVVALLLDTGSDYASNIDPPSYPDGLDVEAFSRTALERAARGARAPAEREHVTLWMRSAGAALRRACLHSPVDASHIRLTVDYPDDLEVVRKIVVALGGAPQHGDYYDILRCIDADRSLLQLNQHARNEGLRKSLETSPLDGRVSLAEG